MLTAGEAGGACLSAGPSRGDMGREAGEEQEVGVDEEGGAPQDGEPFELDQLDDHSLSKIVAHLDGHAVGRLACTSKVRAFLPNQLRQDAQRGCPTRRRCDAALSGTEGKRGYERSAPFCAPMLGVV